MSTLHRIGRHFWRLAGSQTSLAFIFRAAGVVLSLVAASLAARVLLPEKYGQYAWILSLTGLLSFPTTAGFRQLVTRETAYFAAEHSMLGAYGLWNWCLRLSSMFSLAAAIGLGIWGGFFIEDDVLRAQLSFAVALLFILPLSKTFSGALQGLGRIPSCQMTEVIIRPAMMIVMLLPVMVLLEPGNAPVTLALTMICIATLGEALMGAGLLGLFRRETLRAVLTEKTQLDTRALVFSAISFGGIGGIQVVNANLDVLMLGILRSPAETGLFRSATTLAALASFGLVVVNIVIMHQFAKLYKEGEHKKLQALLTRSTRVIFFASLAGIIPIFYAGKFFLGLFFGADFIAAYWALFILAFGQFLSSFFGPVALVMNMTGNEQMTLYSVAAALLANLALNLSLVPTYGIEGAAIATAASLLLWNVFLAAALRLKTGFTSWII